MKTINLTSLTIHRIYIDYDRQVVMALFSVSDDTGQEWERQEATFWVTPPEDILSNPLWFTLPSSYVPPLVQMRDDAQAALVARFLS